MTEKNINIPPGGPRGGPLGGGPLPRGGPPGGPLPGGPLPGAAPDPPLACELSVSVSDDDKAPAPG